MAQFATAAELAGRLGVTLTESEETRAGGLLTRASALIQQEARQLVERIEDDELTRRGTAEERVRLPERPVDSVASVTLDGEAVAQEEWYVEGDELVRRVGGWGYPGQELAITYTHGYAEIPGAIKVVALEAVVRVWVNPGAAVRERFGSESVDYALGGAAGAVGMMLTGSECRTIREALRRTAGSVSLR